jgi:8-oxo-dGTP pyrophosphatase MutT (NUDIX family)
VAVAALVGVFEIVDSVYEEHRVVVVFRGSLTGEGARRLDPEELSELRWFGRDELRREPLSVVAQGALSAEGLL